MALSERRLMTALEQQNEKLSRARRDLFAAEENVKTLLRAECSSLATAEKYAAWDAALKSAGLEVQRHAWILAIIESGGDPQTEVMGGDNR
ncbi:MULTISPECIES: hypothetical protein [unclassified Bradyrhizobium]|uniref:hypothetical protein n=1 Tax=unclassified Bradyrhizobium TaxID=2631580 RepID=UPI001FF8CBA9|nr:MULTISPECIES: hypothetical protein [unclassified Bradyrhizobium]MCK1424597.1 hypothetical protein [Bradyrhizobium sp. CW12]MCK1646460.1 hypothetical protein [Bradyrhizobium sp. 154]MCK1758755.1 hypothetical protein [Bradyrhizobium sp. 137]